MTKPRTVTHVYSLGGGWEKTSHETLTPELAEELRHQGFTMVRARRGMFDTREISLRDYPPQRAGAPTVPS